MLRSVAILLAALPHFSIAADSPAKIYDLSEVFGESWLNLGRQHDDESSSSSSSLQKVIMSGGDDGGMFWNTNPLPCGNYELNLDLYLNLPDPLIRSKFEGIGLWIIDNTTISEISDSYLSHSADRDLLNYRTDYIGYGTFFSILNRKKILKPSISVLFNDGTPLYSKDIPTEFGLYFNYTQIPQIQLNLSVKKNHVTTRAKTSKGDWKKISGVSGGTQVCGYLGISSSNRRRQISTSKGGEAVELEEEERRGADLLFVNATLTTTDQDFYFQMIQEAHPQQLEILPDEQQKGLDGKKVQEEGEGEDLLDDLPSTYAVEKKSLPKKKVVKKSVKPEIVSSGVVQDVETVTTPPAQILVTQEQYDHSKLENLLASLHKKFTDLEKTQKTLGSDLLALTKTVQSESQKTELKHDQQILVRQQRLDSLFAELKDLIKKSGESRAINIADTHKSFEDLQANAASLESTVRMASTYSTYLAAGLFVSFLVFGGVIYKRMKDMEKKHFL